MLSTSAIALLAIGMVVVLIAPGPTKTLLASAGLRQGVRRSLALFVATLLNLKGLLFASTIFPAIAFAYVPAYVFSMLMFACLLVPIALAWIAFGVFSLSLAWAALH